jgi:hypothetical protein
VWADGSSPRGCCKSDAADVPRQAGFSAAWRHEPRRQAYNFSPPGTTFEREDWTVLAEGVTHLQLWMKPDKGGKPYRATLTSLVFKRAEH